MPLLWNNDLMKVTLKRKLEKLDSERPSGDHPSISLLLQTSTGASVSLWPCWDQLPLRDPHKSPGSCRDPSRGCGDSDESCLLSCSRQRGDTGMEPGVIPSHQRHREVRLRQTQDRQAEALEAEFCLQNMLKSSVPVKMCFFEHRVIWVHKIKWRQDHYGVPNIIQSMSL